MPPLFTRRSTPLLLFHAFVHCHDDTICFTLHGAADGFCLCQLLPPFCHAAFIIFRFSLMLVSFSDAYHIVTFSPCHAAIVDVAAFLFSLPADYAIDFFFAIFFSPLPSFAALMLSLMRCHAYFPSFVRQPRGCACHTRHDAPCPRFFATPPLVIFFFMSCLLYNMNTTTTDMLISFMSAARR